MLFRSFKRFIFILFACFVVRVCRPPGATIHAKTAPANPRRSLFEKCLILDLTLSDDGKCPALLKSSGIIDLGAFCVEL